VGALARKAEKLGALLGLGRSASVLLIGELPEGWETDFRTHFNQAAVAGWTGGLEPVVGEGGNYDLIVLGLRPIALKRAIDQAVPALRRALTPNGSLFAVIDNRLAARNFFHNPTRLLARGTSSLVGFRRKLGRAGFEVVEQFLPFPSVENVEEFLNSDSGAAALPSHASVIEVLLNRFGLLPIFHSGGAYIASGPYGGTLPLLRELGAHLGAAGHHPDQLGIERFDLRERGALIVVLRQLTSKKRLLCRITTRTAADRIVRRNTEWTERLVSAQALSTEVKSAIPRPIGTFALVLGTAYVEGHVPGIIAWKLAGSVKLEPTLYSQLYAFITRFNRDTQRTLRIDDAALTQLLDPFVPCRLNDQLAAAHGALRERLAKRMLGRDRTVVWAHGDFGYGNALVDPRTGTLNGVIDWDQAREDLAGVDLVHFLVQRERGRSDYSLQRTLEEVARHVRRYGIRNADGGQNYEQELGLSPESRSELLALVALRFAQRTLIYSLSGTAEESAFRIMEWAITILE
jgi:hypothetical protein